MKILQLRADDISHLVPGHALRPFFRDEGIGPAAQGVVLLRVLPPVRRAGICEQKRGENEGGGQDEMTVPANLQPAADRAADDRRRRQQRKQNPETDSRQIRKSRSKITGRELSLQGFEKLQRAEPGEGVPVDKLQVVNNPRDENVHRAECPENRQTPDARKLFQKVQKSDQREQIQTQAHHEENPFRSQLFQSQFSPPSGLFLTLWIKIPRNTVKIKVFFENENTFSGGLFRERRLKKIKI